MEDHRDRPDFIDWLEAWCNGFNAAQSDHPNDESIIRSARAAYENSGRQRAIKHRVARTAHKHTPDC